MLEMMCTEICNNLLITLIMTDKKLSLLLSLLSSMCSNTGYWHQRADERHGNPPQGNQELLVVRDKVGRPPVELGLSKSMECDIFPSVLRHCWLGDRKGIRPVKNWMLVCWCWWFDRSFARLIAPVVTTTSIILCFNKHRLTQVHLENGH